MDPILQTGGQALTGAGGSTAAGGADAANSAAAQEATNKVAQQIFGIVLNLVMSQTGEG